MAGGLSQGGISRVRVNRRIPATEVCSGSKDDLQRPLERRRLSARNETFGVERQQSACKPDAHARTSAIHLFRCLQKRRTERVHCVRSGRPQQIQASIAMVVLFKS